MRDYTGFDGFATGKQPGLEAFVQAMSTQSGQRVWNNGTFAKRKKRGAENSSKMSGWSIHSTGRAADISRRAYHGRPGCTRADMLKVADWLVAVADDIGLEYLADYEYGEAGRGWKCDRDDWKVYRPGVIKGGGWGDWLHFELDPQHASDDSWVAGVMSSFPLSAGTPKPAPEPAPAVWVSCRLGDEGENVRQVQQVLHDQGYKNGSGRKPILVDGDFGQVTDKRVREYQQQHDLIVDGIAGKQTAGHMGLLDS